MWSRKLKIDTGSRSRTWQTVGDQGGRAGCSVSDHGSSGNTHVSETIRITPQVRLLVTLLPHVALSATVSLSRAGRRSICSSVICRACLWNRLAYVPVARSRDKFGCEVGKALKVDCHRSMSEKYPGCNGHGAVLSGRRLVKLLVGRVSASRVKIEVSPVLRGVRSHQKASAGGGAQALWLYEVPVLTFEDLYAGKLCAALDRQHPRDLFDVRQLL